MEALLSLASQVREHYLNEFLESLATFKATYSPSAPEVLLEVQREAAYPFRLYRVDMASNADSDPKFLEVNPDTHLSFAPFTREILHGLHVTVHPIAWNGIDIQVNTTTNLSAVEAWALRWLDVEDGHDQDLNGLQGVIHSVTSPTTGVTHSEFSIDLGSAPVRALEELLCELQTLGASEVKLWSSCLA